MNTWFSTLLRMNNPADFRFRWTLSAGEAEPPRAALRFIPAGSRLSRLSC